MPYYMASTTIKGNQTITNNLSVSPSGKVTNIGGWESRTGNVVEIVFDATMNGVETSDWIDVGSTSFPPKTAMSYNFISDSTTASSLRVRVQQSTGLIRLFYGGNAQFHVHLIYIV